MQEEVQVKSTLTVSADNPSKKYHLKDIFSDVSSALRGKRINPIKKRRIYLGERLSELYECTIMYGPFKGFKLSDTSWWGRSDRGSMLLGLYEKEVLESLSGLSGRYSYFMDIGAADGYYGIGVLVGRLFEKSICYELSESGRKAIEVNAEVNGVSNQIKIHGVAEKAFYEDYPPDVRSRTVLFIDVEGAEFDLLDRDAFIAFKDSVIFVELHDWFFDDGDQRLARLTGSARETHRTTKLTMGPRDPSVFPELRYLHDDDRWIICSEGRGQLMSWYRFDPI
jgi:hypothetical protein